MTVSSVETNSPRHFVGRVHRGRDLRDALRELAREHGLTVAWITAMGAFEWVTLTEYNQETQAYEPERRVGACELLSLEGNLSERDGEPFWHLHATVSEGGSERRVYAGHLVDASVFALEFRVTGFDGVMLRRAHDEATGLALWDFDGAAGVPAAASGVSRRGSAGAAPEPTAEEGGAVTWAMAAQASEDAKDPVPVDHEPSKGEWIDHPKFGVCKIEGISGDGVAILKLPNTRRKKVQLGIFDIFEPRQDGPRRIYPLQKRRESPSPKG